MGLWATLRIFPLHLRGAKPAIRTYMTHRSSPICPWISLDVYTDCLRQGAQNVPSSLIFSIAPGYHMLSSGQRAETSSLASGSLCKLGWS